MAKNRVEAEYVEALKEFADLYWSGAIEEAHTVFSMPAISADAKLFYKDVTFKANAEKAILQKLKLMAQAKSGAIHPNGHNTNEEKTEAARALAEARKLLSVKREASDDDE